MRGGFQQNNKTPVWRLIPGIMADERQKYIDRFQHDAILNICAVHRN
jgi:hypothetical protein